ncbi:wall-associated receptor kinase-like 1 [Vigna unguiculata]|uniref:wall-associated receptor kinase-like 1 n=1 Tax=Vigna unguiculata TaxID=3917 RepID=UPI00101620E3|nr:wall-associated receptor kinase-like 1 [Vigna unguiculata]
MILKLVYHFMILILWFIHVDVSAQGDLYVAKPGCDSQCGDLQIPFPFGMKSSECYAGKWFEIECRNTSTYQTPYLKSIGVEVTSIDVEGGTVTINNPINRDNCGTKHSPAVNQSLEGSPFVYSQEHNKFVAAGCNIIVFLQVNGTESSGCVSICDEDLKVDDIGKMELKNSDCNGKNCCQNSLPPYLKEYSTQVKGLKENVTDGECSYAMVIQQNLNSYDYLSYPYYAPKSYYFPVNGEMKDLDVVPVVLEWEILNNMNLNLPTLSQCYDTNVTSSRYKRSGQRCSCLGGSSFGSNPYLEGGCSADYSVYQNSPSHLTISVIKGISISFGSIILLLILWRVFKVTKKTIVKKWREKFFKKNGGLLLQQRLSSGEINVDKVKLFSLKELQKATDNFNANRVLGKGGQATVYKGMLIDGTIIAVKKFKVQGKIEEFINEFVILSQINHRNVVKLLGSCLETKIPLLVYEFIPNGNLFEYLHQQNEDLPMTWEMRLRIATEVAGALFYLHSAASQPIYHKDIKSTNILLDEKYRAKVADFGTSRMISIDVTHLTTVVQGTFGYLDPEFFQTSQFTEKSDVYSFGVVLVELLTGQKPITLLSQEEAKSLASYFIMCVEENCVFDIIDERVMKEGEKDHIMKVVNLASQCLKLNGKRRPTMREITLELEGIRKLVKESNAQELHNEFVRSEDCQSWDDNSIISEIISTFDLSSRTTILKDVHIVTI